MSDKYLSRMSDDELRNLADFTEPGAVLIDVAHNDGSVSVIVSSDLEGEEGSVEDTFVFDDYVIDSYDVPVAPDVIFEYRKDMLTRFGAEYAEDFLTSVVGYTELL